MPVLISNDLLNRTELTLLELLEGTSNLQDKISPNDFTIIFGNISRWIFLVFGKKMEIVVKRMNENKQKRSKARIRLKIDEKFSLKTSIGC